MQKGLFLVQGTHDGSGSHIASKKHLLLTQPFHFDDDYSRTSPIYGLVSSAIIAEAKRRVIVLDGGGLFYNYLL